MEYQAIARYRGQTLTGHIHSTDHGAIESVVSMLPSGYYSPDVVLIVEDVYRDGNHVSYVTTLFKYQVATE